VSALEHWKAYNKPYEGDKQFWAPLSLCVCVIDAPLVVVEEMPSAPAVRLCPWIRVKRQESVIGRDDRRRPKHYVIDVVHKSFLEEFITKEVSSLTELYCHRVKALTPILADCRGSVQNIDSFTWGDLIPKK
jgi:hypothetical protein